MHTKIGRALVLGAGVAGIRAALDLAQLGYKVTLAEREAYTGGMLMRLDHQFPSNHCGICRMLPTIGRQSVLEHCLRKGLFHENIEVLTGTELADLEGEPGSFEAVLRRRDNPVDPALCVGCGVCAQVCPVEIPDPFNLGLSKKKAAYRPLPHAPASPYLIDTRRLHPVPGLRDGLSHRGHFPG